jgi:hypothetical protein
MSAGGAAGVADRIAEDPQPGLAPDHRAAASHDVVFACMGTVSLHHVGIAATGDLEHLRKIGRVVLQIGVERGDPPTVRRLDARVHRRTLPPWRRPVQHPQPRSSMRQFTEPGEGLIRRAVIHHDQLGVDPRAAHRPLHLLDQRADVFLFVERRHDDRQVAPRGRRARGCGGGRGLRRAELRHGSVRLVRRRQVAALRRVHQRSQSRRSATSPSATGWAMPRPSRVCHNCCPLDSNS